MSCAGVCGMPQADVVAAALWGRRLGHVRQEPLFMPWEDWPRELSPRDPDLPNAFGLGLSEHQSPAPGGAECFGCPLCAPRRALRAPET
jgi:hypothetical protein